MKACRNRVSLPSLVWLPLPLLLVALAACLAFDPQTVVQPPYLLPALNLLFSTGVSVLIAVLAARSYLAGGSSSVLLLGAAMLLFGVASYVGGLLSGLRDPNDGIALFNIVLVLTALGHLLGALPASPPSPSHSRRSGRHVWTTYGAVLLVLVLLLAAIRADLVPPFFIQGQGSTPIRHAVLGSAILLFAAATLQWGQLYRRARVPFLGWYALGLAMIAVALVALFAQKAIGTPLNWVGRGGQYLGAVYMLLAVRSAMRQTGRWSLPLEQALQESEARYQGLVEVSPDAILVHQDGRYVFANAAAARLLGASTPAEIVGREVLAFIRDADRDDVRQRIADAYAGKALPLREFTFVRLDGQFVPVEATGGLLQFDGRPAIQTVMRDVSERKRAEEGLRASERLYRAIGESIDYGVWVCAPDGRNVYASPSFLKLVGSTQQQCSDFGWGDVLHPDDAPRTVAAWKECVRTGGMWDIEHRFRGVDGQWHDVLARGVPVRDEQGRITCWAGINLDISRLKRVEGDLRHAVSENQMLLREVHHRVKNNLQMLCDLMYLQMEALPDRERHQDLQDAYGRIYAIARLHEQLYQSLESGRVRLGEYLERLVSGYGSLYPRIPVRLDAEREGLALDLDRAIHVGLIVNELVTNAVKHAFPHGQAGEVVVALRSLGEQVQIQVRDNGRGLPADLDPAKGKTLGLRTVHILAKRLDAVVDVQNQDGTSFTITFPLAAELPIEPRPE